jgi:NADH dehydrogenase
MPVSNRKKIIVIGAGFGGLRAALDIGKKIANQKLHERYEVVLIDQNSYHTYTPTLYEIATTDETLASQLDLKNLVTIDIKKSTGNLPIEVVQAKVYEINTQTGDIHFEHGTRIQFDYLVLALGSQVNYFGIPGLAEYAYTLKTVYDALKLRTRLIEEVESPACRLLRIVIGGGGSTGVELAAEIKLALSHIRRVATGECGVEVTVIDGGATVLSPFGTRIIAATIKRFSTLEIKTLTPARITGVTESEIELEDGTRVPYDVLAWTGGVTPNLLMATLKMKKDVTGKRPLMSATLQGMPETTEASFHGSIYGVGDAVCFIDPATNRPVPGVAPAAIKQAKIVAHNIFEEIRLAEKITTTPKFKIYKPQVYPYIVPVGGKFAVTRFGPIVISGFAAWLLKGLVEGNYLFSILPFFAALRLWMKGLWIFMRNDRLG